MKTALSSMLHQNIKSFQEVTMNLFHLHIIYVLVLIFVS